MAIREDAINFTAQITQAEITNLATELGVSPESLASLHIGKNESTQEYTFPIRQPNGYIIGTSSRPIAQNSDSTKKTRGRGAGNGLLFIPWALSPDYVILTEGASDTAAVVSAGFSSVVGKVSALVGIENIVSLCQRLRPRLVINLRDADKAGSQGHKKLLRAFGALHVVELLPADGYKDAREWHQADPIGMRNAIVDQLQRIDLSANQYSIPSLVSLSDYATPHALSLASRENYQLGGYVEPINPDFRLGAVPVELPPVATEAPIEAANSTEQLLPTLDRNLVRFIATIGVAGEQIVSEPVDHTKPAQVDEFIHEWSTQHNLVVDHLRLAIPHAVQGCLARVASHQKQRPARLDILDDTPERVEPITKNIDSVAAWCLSQLSRTSFGTDWSRIVAINDGWYMYQEGIGYREASEKEIEGELLQLINRAVRNSTISFRREIKEHIRPSVKAPSSLKLGHWMPPKIGQFDPENTLRSEYYQLERDFPSREMLATPAGLIHLPTVSLECPEYLPISPNWFGSVTTEVSIEPYAQCPGWHAHLDRVFGTDESGIQNREALQDWFGYLLMPHARLNKFCILHGASQSGKSTCLRVLMALVKSKTISAAQLGQQFGLSELVGITHAAIDEMKIDKNWFQSTATARLLSVTGGMQTPIEIKFQQSVNTHPALKFTMTANAMPGFDNSHDAITNRIHPIYFARTIPVGERRNGIEQEWIQRELSGILAWAIEGYQRVFSQNRLSLPGSLEESIAQLNQETDPIAEFMGESITQVRSQIATLRLADLFDAYRGYCSEVNVRAITRRALEQLITTRYGISVTIPSNHHHVRASEIRGYALTPEGNGYRSAYIVKKNQ